MHLSVNVQHPYDVPVSPHEQYLYLDAITVSGGASGALVSAGIEWRAPQVLNVTAFAQYAMLPDLKATINEAQTATVKLNSAGIGLKVHVILY